MKKPKIIISTVSLGIALILEALPFGIIIDWGGFHQTTTYHSYFDADVWVNGDVGPMLCGIFTVAALCMTLLSLFIKVHRSYMLSDAAITISAVVLSLIPTFYGEYSVFGLAITILLSVATELNILTFLDKKK